MQLRQIATVFITTPLDSLHSCFALNFCRSYQELVLFSSKQQFGEVLLGRVLVALSYHFYNFIFMLLYTSLGAVMHWCCIIMYLEITFCSASTGFVPWCDVGELCCHLWEGQTCWGPYHVLCWAWARRSPGKISCSLGDLANFLHFCNSRASFCRQTFIFFVACTCIPCAVITTAALYVDYFLQHWPMCAIIL